MQSEKFDVNYLTFQANGNIDYSSQKFAPLGKYPPFWWESLFNWSHADFVHRNVLYPLYISGIYLVVIFGLQAIMKGRKGFGLKRELAIWNAALGLFSIMGVVRVAPDLWAIVNQTDGIWKSLCVKEDYSVPIAFWSWVFIFSKVVELGDTLFIVLRKRPLQFLQWFHHAMSLTLAWTTGPYLEPICRYYILMNYAVHSLMYPYFALKAMDVHIPKKIANIITLAQFVQMVLGVSINFYTAYLYYFHASCHRHPFSIKMICLAYGSFLILFGELLYRLVLKKSDRKKKE